MVKRVHLVAAVLAAAAPLTVATASAWAAGQGRWMPPQELTHESAITPQVVISESGEGLATWGHRSPDPGAAVGSASISIRPPGGEFGQPHVVTPDGVIFVGMAANPAGDAAITYLHGGQIGVVFRQALGAFGPPAETPGPWDGVAMDGLGRTTILSKVEEYDGAGNHVGDRLLARTRAPNEPFGPAREVGYAQHIANPRVAADGTGKVTAFWRGGSWGSSIQPSAATAAPGSEFSERSGALGSPDPNDNSNETRVVTNARGDVLVAWAALAPGEKPSDPGVRQVLHTSFRPAGGSFGPDEIADTPVGVGLYGGWDLAMDQDGDVAATWSDQRTAYVAFRKATGPWTAGHGVTGDPGPTCCPEPKPPPPDQTQPTVSFDGKGVATIAWVQIQRDEHGLEPSGQELMAIRRSRDGKFGKPQHLAHAKHIFTPDSAGDTFGNTIIVWSHEERWGWDASETEHGIGSVVWDARKPSVSDFDLDLAARRSDGPSPAFRYRLSEAARVRVTVERVGRHPTRLGKVTFRARRGPGARTIGSKLATRLGRRASYRATIVARDSAGRRSRPRHLSFESVKP